MLRRIATIFTLSAIAVTPALAEMSAKALNGLYTDSGVKWAGCPEFLPKDCALSVLNGDPAKPNADLWFKLMPGSDLPEHYHTSAERMVLVSGELNIQYTGQDPVVLKPGMYAYGPANLAHKGSCSAGSDPCVLFIAFEGPVDAMPTKK
jgi:quercetin dioxygenase-like cupin family protein